jgi:hypothetical protein
MGKRSGERARTVKQVAANIRQDKADDKPAQDTRPYKNSAEDRERRGESSGHGKKDEKK